MRLRSPFYVVALSAMFTLAEADDCLKVLDYDVTEPQADYGVVELEWQAEIENRCDSEYYATVTLSFLDSKQQSLQNSLTSSLVKQGATVRISKKAMLTDRQYEQVETTGISVSGKTLD